MKGQAMRITFDPEANAVYVQLPRAEPGDIGETLVRRDGVILDRDSHGGIRGYEFLCAREKGLPMKHLPKRVRRALKAFMLSGALDSLQFVEHDAL